MLENTFGHVACDVVLRGLHFEGDTTILLHLKFGQQFATIASQTFEPALKQRAHMHFYQHEEAAEILKRQQSVLVRLNRSNQIHVSQKIVFVESEWCRLRALFRLVYLVARLVSVPVARNYLCCINTGLSRGELLMLAPREQAKCTC